MTIKSFFLANGIVLFLKNMDKKEKIKELAESIDKEADLIFQNQSEGVQQNVVQLVLLPLASELMKENPAAYAKILEDELKRVFPR